MHFLSERECVLLERRTSITQHSTTLPRHVPDFKMIKQQKQTQTKPSARRPVAVWTWLTCADIRAANVRRCSSSSHLSGVDGMPFLFRACPASRVTLVKQLASAPQDPTAARSHVSDLRVSELLHACGAAMQCGDSPRMTLLLISASHHAPLTLSTGTGRGRISLLSLFPTGVKPHADSTPTIRCTRAPPNKQPEDVR